MPLAPMPGQHRQCLELRHAIARGPGLLRAPHLDHGVADRLSLRLRDQSERVGILEPLLVEVAPHRPRIRLGTNLAENRQLRRHLRVMAAQRLPERL